MVMVTMVIVIMMVVTMVMVTMVIVIMMVVTRVMVTIAVVELIIARIKVSLMATPMTYHTRSLKYERIIKCYY